MGKKNEAYFRLETSTGEAINLLPVEGNADAIIMDVISDAGWELTPVALGKKEALRLAVALNAFFDFGEDVSPADAPGGEADIAIAAVERSRDWSDYDDRPGVGF